MTAKMMKERIQQITKFHFGFDDKNLVL